MSVKLHCLIWLSIASKATSRFAISPSEDASGLRVHASVKGRQIINPDDYDEYVKILSASPTKWLNTLKQFVVNS